MAIRPDLQLVLELPITFRFAQEEDLPKLEWYGQYTHFRQLYRRTFADQLAGRRFMLLAVCQDFPIGQIFIHISRPPFFTYDQHAYFYSLRVMDMFQRLGIGTRLLEAAEAIAIERGMRRATIAAAKNNPGARRLYERTGYKVFREDAGEWDYIDHKGDLQHVSEPSWVLEKNLVAR